MVETVGATVANSVVVEAVGPAVADGVAVEAVGVAVDDGVSLEAIARVAVADTVLPPGSDTVNAKVEFWSELSGVGLSSSPVSCATVRFSPTLTGVVPSASSTVPFDGSAVTVTLSWEAGKLASLGVGIPIAVAALFSVTVSEVEFSVNPAAAADGELLEAAGAAVTDGVLVEAITRVAVAETVLPPRSDTVNARAELWPALLGAGSKPSPVNCATVNVSLTVTGVSPSDSRTVPFDGSVPTVTVNCEEE